MSGTAYYQGVGCRLSGQAKREQERGSRQEHELLVKCVIKPKMQVIYAWNVYCSLGEANLPDVRPWAFSYSPPGELIFTNLEYLHDVCTNGKDDSGLHQLLIVKYTR